MGCRTWSGVGCRIWSGAAGGHLVHAVEEEDEPSLEHRLLEEEVAARARAVDAAEIAVEVVAAERVLLDRAHQVDRRQQEGHQP